jgi:hypothetical protein
MQQEYTRVMGTQEEQGNLALKGHISNQFLEMPKHVVEQSI